MPADDIRAIELRRLHELDKQAAAQGPKTDPAILIEIQDLHNRYPDAPRNGARTDSMWRTAAQTEMDFVMNALAAALQRITLVEQRQTQADSHRRQLGRQLDQVLYNIDDLSRWVKVGGIGIALALLIGFVLAIVVF
jgi:hypothetical protein